MHHVQTLDNSDYEGLSSSDSPDCFGRSIAQNAYAALHYRHHIGLPLRTYLLDRKINCAKKLLQQWEIVTEACYLSGSNDYANFIQSFKQSVGISPVKYKRGSSTQFLISQCVISSHVNISVICNLLNTVDRQSTGDCKKKTTPCMFLISPSSYPAVSVFPDNL